MTNSRRKGKLEVIENYTSASTAALKTFTFGAIDFSTISHLILDINLGVTAALTLEMKVNGIATAYYLDGTYTKGGTTTIIDLSNTTEMDIVPAALLSAANKFVHAIIQITVPQSIATQKPQIIIDYTQDGARGSLAGQQAADTPSLTSITIETDTSTWQANTRMTLYKVYR